MRSKYKPEWALAPAMAESPLVSVGVISMAWTARTSIHWIVPVIAMGIYAAGSLACFSSSVAYLVHCYAHISVLLPQPELEY